MWPRNEFIKGWVESVAVLQSLSNTSSIEPKVPLVKGSWSCLVHLVESEFGNSYGKPVKGTFEPNRDCKMYNQVVLRLEASVQGRQFDRTGGLYVLLYLSKLAGRDRVIEIYYCRAVWPKF